MKKKKHVKSAPKPKRARKPSAAIYIPLILISVFVLIITVFKITEYIILQTSNSNDFPKLEISLTEAPIEKIDMGSKDTKYPKNTLTFTANNESSDFYDVEIKGRGNLTWLQPKKPYQIKFTSKTSFFELKEAKKWLLLANYLDPSHLRNDVAFYLQSIFNTPFSPKGNFIELYIDNNYRGIYYLSDKIELGKSRVNLTDSFGLLVELDNIHKDLDNCNYDEAGNCFIIKDSVNADNSNTDTIKSFLHKINTLQEAILAKNFTEVETVIDVDSFARYYLLNEFTVNPDAYGSSFFFYQDGLDDKVHAGPGWDFDLALGNKGWAEVDIGNDLFHSPFEDTIVKKYLAEIGSGTSNTYANTIAMFMYDLLDLPEFKTRVKEIYQQTLSGHGDELLNYIESRADYIRPAALRDQERWKLTTNFDDEVDYLIDWVAKRYNHFEEVYGVGANT